MSSLISIKKKQHQQLSFFQWSSFTKKTFSRDKWTFSPISLIQPKFSLLSLIYKRRPKDKLNSIGHTHSVYSLHSFCTTVKIVQLVFYQKPSHLHLYQTHTHFFRFGGNHKTKIKEVNSSATCFIILNLQNHKKIRNLFFVASTFGVALFLPSTSFPL